VDCWSLGVILFELFSQQKPFTIVNGSSDQEELFSVIKKGKFQFDERWEGISKEAKDLVKKLLELDPSTRFSMMQVKAHPWFESF
jgi:serine/threonine protein kinase